MSVSDSDDQNDELTALASIYDETIIKMYKDSDQLYCGTLTIRIELTKPYYVKLGAHGSEYKIHHLPPLILSLTLPSDYPSKNPPQYSICCIWLSSDQRVNAMGRVEFLKRLMEKRSDGNWWGIGNWWGMKRVINVPLSGIDCLYDWQIMNIRNYLDEIWNTSQGTVILFMWMSFLLNDLLEHLHITSPLVVTAEVLASVIENDQIMNNQIFATTVFRCEVCFNDKLGAACTRFEPCEHVFCQSCVRNFFEIHIAEGSVPNVKCLSPNCQTQAHPSQVKAMVSTELYERYDRLLLQRSLDTMTDVVYCPRKDCMCPVLVEQGETMASCPSCRYVFCTLCKMVYHGISPCKILSENFEAVRAEYLEADEAGKRELLKRYGKRTLLKAIEESFSRDWLNVNCKQCPHCRTQIEKKDGCNKMTCTKCHAYFCWLCLTLLAHNNPYSHFNSSTSPCFNKLFLGVETDGDEEFFEEI